MHRNHFKILLYSLSDYPRNNVEQQHLCATENWHNATYQLDKYQWSTAMHAQYSLWQ